MEDRHGETFKADEDEEKGPAHYEVVHLRAQSRGYELEKTDYPPIPKADACGHRYGVDDGCNRQRQR